MRLIDADAMDALLDLEYIYQPEHDGGAYYRVDDVWDCIDAVPTAELKERDTPKKLKVIGCCRYCPVCGEQQKNGTFGVWYCERCGQALER